MMSTLSYTLGQLAAHVGAELRGDADLPIQGLATLQEAGPAQLSFLANPQYRKYLPESRAGAVLLTAADADGFAGTALVVANPTWPMPACRTCSIASRRRPPVSIPPPSSRRTPRSIRAPASAPMR